jgi:hypothetical protein
MCVLYRSGLTLQQVGDRYGVSRERVRQVIVAAGVTSRDGGTKIRAKKRAQRKRTIAKQKRDAKAFSVFGCDYATAKHLNGGYAPWAKGTAASLYGRQRVNAHKRSIPWLITFPEWLAVWRDSGHLDERGRGRDLYCMARYHDKGGYEVGNVYIATIAQNVKDYQSELKRRGVECADGWKRLPERKHQTSETPRCELVHRGAPPLLGLGRGRGWSIPRPGAKKPYRVTCGRQYIGSFATQQQAELAYRFACEEAIRKQAA